MPDNLLKDFQKLESNRSGRRKPLMTVSFSVYRKYGSKSSFQLSIIINEDIVSKLGWQVGSAIEFHYNAFKKVLCLKESKDKGYKLTKSGKRTYSTRRSIIHGNHNEPFEKMEGTGYDLNKNELDIVEENGEMLLFLYVKRLQDLQND